MQYLQHFTMAQFHLQKPTNTYTIRTQTQRYLCLVHCHSSCHPHLAAHKVDQSSIIFRSLMSSVGYSFIYLKKLLRIHTKRPWFILMSHTVLKLITQEVPLTMSQHHAAPMTMTNCNGCPWSKKSSDHCDFQWLKWMGKAMVICV